VIKYQTELAISLVSLCSFAGGLNWAGLFGDQSVALYKHCFLHIVVAKLTRKPSLDVFVCHNYSLNLCLAHLVPDVRQWELFGLEPWRDFATSWVELFYLKIGGFCRNSL
jgi:hypothetical protein